MNITLHLLTYIIKTKAGLQNVQIQLEMKSSVQMAGSKVVVNFGCGEHHLAVKATPDFYIRKQSPVVYLTIGEVENVGSGDPEMQLAVGALSMLARKKKLR